MRLLKSAFIVAAVVLASPVWAHGGHGHGHGHGHKHHRHHHGWDERRDHSEWRHHRHHRRFDDRRYVYSRHYVYPAYPVYAAPAPGVHIVVPNIYIPLR
jgi:hypothetical protein